MVGVGLVPVVAGQIRGQVAARLFCAFVAPGHGVSGASCGTSPGFTWLTRLGVLHDLVDAECSLSDVSSPATDCTTEAIPLGRRTFPAGAW